MDRGDDNVPFFVLLFDNYIGSGGTPDPVCTMNREGSVTFDMRGVIVVNDGSSL